MFLCLDLNFITDSASHHPLKMELFGQLFVPLVHIAPLEPTLLINLCVLRGHTAIGLHLWRNQNAPSVLLVTTALIQVPISLSYSHNQCSTKERERDGQGHRERILILMCLTLEDADSLLLKR